MISVAPNKTSDCSWKIDQSLLSSHFLLSLRKGLAYCYITTELVALLLLIANILRFTRNDYSTTGIRIFAWHAYCRRGWEDTVYCRRSFLLANCYSTNYL